MAVLLSDLLKRNRQDCQLRRALNFLLFKSVAGCAARVFNYSSASSGRLTSQLFRNWLRKGATHFNFTQLDAREPGNEGDKRKPKPLKNTVNESAGSSGYKHLRLRIENCIKFLGCMRSVSPVPKVTVTSKSTTSRTMTEPVVPFLLAEATTPGQCCLRLVYWLNAVLAQI